MYKYKQIVIGIDQSYKHTGISIIADNVIKKVTSKDLTVYKTNTERRKVLKKTLSDLLSSVVQKAESVVCIIERIRLQSRGFLNINYIKSIGALNALIVDVMASYNVPVFSVDTRCWKAQVVGTSKPLSNKYGVPEEKWPTVHWVIEQGFESSILKQVSGRKSKGTFMKGHIKYMYDNDAADSCAIAMFFTLGDRSKLREEH